jgi:hypothetical protein
LINHLRYGLDQGDARIGDIVVGPGRAALLDKSLGVVDKILKGAITSRLGAGSMS